MKHTLHAPASADDSRLQQFHASLNTFDNDWETYFPAFEKRGYQIQKIRKILEGFEKQQTNEITKRALADITPPSGGKTFMMAMLAKIMLEQGIPSIIGMWNKSNITGPDNALLMFQKIFGSENVGVVTGTSQDFSKPITLITASSFAKRAHQFTSKRINIMLDEGDTFQTDLRQSALEKVIPQAYITMFSATTILNGKNIRDWAEVVDEMYLHKLIQAGYAKHIIGHYYVGQISIRENSLDGSEVSFNKLYEAEKDWLIDSTFEIFQKAPHEKHLIHCQSLEQCIRTHKKFIDNGISAQYVSHTKDDNKQAEDDYVHGSCQVLISVDMHTRGFSDKGVTSNEIFAKISGSESLVYQSLLRGSRPSDEHPALNIYQLLPSTIETRGFVPVLMHQCFHLPIDDMSYWRTGKEAGKSLPIQFISSEKEGNIESKKKKKNIALGETIQFAAINDIKTVIDTRNEQERITDYVVQNLYELVASALESQKKHITESAGLPRTMVVKEINILGKPVSITRGMIRNAVFAFLTSKPKNETEDNATLVTRRIQERYAFGKAPVEEGLAFTLGIEDIRPKEQKLFHVKFIEKHAIEIFELFKSTHQISLVRPDRFSNHTVQFGDITIRFATFLFNILRSVSGCNQSVAKNRPMIASATARERYETGIKPDSKATQKKIVESYIYPIEIFKQYSNQIIDAFLDNYGLTFDEIPSHFSFVHSDAITITIDKGTAITHLKTKNNPEIIPFVSDDFTLDIEYTWGKCMNLLFSSYFTPEFLKQNTLTWESVRQYSTWMAPTIIRHLKHQTLDRNIIWDLLQQKQKSTGQESDVLINGKNIVYVHGLDTLFENNDISLQDIFIGSVKSLRTHNNLHLTFHNKTFYASLTELLTAFIGYYLPNYSKLKTTLGIDQYNHGKYIGQLCAVYIAFPEVKQLFTEEYLTMYLSHVCSKETIEKSRLSEEAQALRNKKNPDILKRIKQNNEQRCDLRNAILDSLFIDEETLHSYGLTVLMYKKLHKAIHDSPAPYIEALSNTPDTFLMQRMHDDAGPLMQYIKLLEKQLQTPQNVQSKNKKNNKHIKKPLISGENKEDSPAGVTIVRNNEFESPETESIHRSPYHQITRIHPEQFEQLAEHRQQVRLRYKQISDNEDVTLQMLRLIRDFTKTFHAHLISVRAKLIASSPQYSIEQFQPVYKTFLAKNAQKEPSMVDEFLHCFYTHSTLYDVVKQLTIKQTPHVSDNHYTHAHVSVEDSTPQTPINTINAQIPEQDIPTPNEQPPITVEEAGDTLMQQLERIIIACKKDKNPNRWNSTIHEHGIVAPKLTAIIEHWIVQSQKKTTTAGDLETLENSIIKSMYWNEPLDSIPPLETLAKYCATGNISELKSIIMRLTIYIDKTISDKKAIGTYTRDVAKDAIAYKDMVFETTGCNYDKMYQLHSDSIRKLNETQLQLFCKTMRDLAEYVTLI